LSKTELIVVAGITLSLYIGMRILPELSYSHMTSGVFLFVSKFGQCSVRFVSRASESREPVMFSRYYASRSPFPLPYLVPIA